MVNAGGIAAVAIVGLGVALGCGSSSNAPPPAPPLAMRPPPPPPPLPPPPPRCVLPPARAQAADASGPAGECRPIAKRVRAQVEAVLAATYLPHVQPSKTYVNEACDPLGEVRDIVLESGTDAEGTLQLWRLTRSGPRFVVTGVGVEASVRGCDDGYLARDACIVRVASGELAADEVDALLPGARAALLSSVFDRATAAGGPVASVIAVSSADLHRRTLLVDAAGRRLERAFTGHDDNGPAQADRLAADLAGARLLRLVESVVRLRHWPVNDDERSFFADRFGAAFGGGRLSPWVARRLVRMAPALAAPDLVPALLRLASDQIALAPAALSGVAAAIGWDARFEDGKPRPPPDVTRDYIAECHL